MDTQTGQQQLVSKKSVSRFTWRSNSSASFKVKMSANTATSTIPENPARFNAARIAPGETPSPNCPINAGAISAYTCFSRVSSTSRTAFKSANFSGKTVSQTGIVRSVFSPKADSPSDHIAFLLSSVSPLCTLFLIFPHAICVCSPSFTPAFSFKDAHTSSFLFFAHFSRCSLMHKRKSHPFLPDDFLFCPGSQNSHFF